MSAEAIGMWLIGAKGGVATTAMTGLAALARQAVEPIGLVTALDPFTQLDLVGFDQIVVGGHDIRSGRLEDEARRMWVESRAITPELLDGASDFFSAVETRLRPGTIVAAGDKICELADPAIVAVVETPRAAIARIRADIEAFAAANRLRHVVVVNVASTEPPAPLPIPNSYRDLAPLLDSAQTCPVPASSLYAIAAFEAGASYINFTPSTGSTPQALCELAMQQGVPHTGCDGKTGETLLKSVLAPMFAARNLDVMSWVGHNIFGNMDGRVLDDPRNKATKVRSSWWTGWGCWLAGWLARTHPRKPSTHARATHTPHTTHSRRTRGASRAWRCCASSTNPPPRRCATARTRRRGWWLCMTWVAAPLISPSWRSRGACLRCVGERGGGCMHTRQRVWASSIHSWGLRGPG